jgi:pimeloyl-ACP methyl ester carboxylesterase
MDFKPLWSRLVDDYRIAVVERAGYGWSRQTMAPRDIDTILAETRSALHAAGIDGPFVLAAHSIAGLEALYWAKKHPEEVSAVIGLDPAVPAVYRYAR